MAEINVFPGEVVRARPLLEVPEPSSSPPSRFGTIESVAAVVSGLLTSVHWYRLPENLSETAGTQAVDLPARYRLVARLLAESMQGDTGHTPHQRHPGSVPPERGSTASQ